MKQKILLASTLHVQYTSTGSLERMNPAIDKIILTDSKIEIVAEGFEWCESPLWLEN
jgi:gluconolactonase